MLTNADNKGPKIDQERWYPPKIVEEHSVLTSKKRGIATELRQLVANLVLGRIGVLATQRVAHQGHRPARVIRKSLSSVAVHVHLTSQ